MTNYRTKGKYYTVLDEPKEEYPTVCCPICGTNEYEQIFRRKHGEYIGCDSCIETIWFDDEQLYEKDEDEGYEG